MFSIAKIQQPELREAITNSLNFIKSEHPDSLRKVILFGSCARGEETKDSDIDLCLVFDDSAEITSRQMLLYKGNLRCVDSHDRDIVFCNQKHLVNQEQLIYRMINHDGKLLLDL